MAHPAEANAYIRSHSQEMSDEVCAAHIALYVNTFSLDLGSPGEAAIADLFARAEAAGLLPASSRDLFMP
jgi:1,4-dihydroxy-6-naphthoate synthase